MADANRSEQRILERVEAAFGYPIDAAVRELLLADWKRDSEDYDAEETFGFFIVRSVAWTAEAHEGRRPDEVAGEAQAARLERELGRPIAGKAKKDEDAADPPDLVARHFCGLLSVEVQYVKRIPEHWVADTNPRDRDGTAPIYKWRAAGHPEGAVFESVAGMEEWKKLIKNLSAADTDDDKAAVQRICAEIRKSHPRALAADMSRLEAKGLLLPELRKPPPDPSFTDEAGARLWAAYRVFLPVGRVLIDRAAGKRQAKLTTAEAKAIGHLGAEGGDWPPALLASMLGPALSGGEADAKAKAKALVKAGSGVPLTRRWASLIAEAKGPFGS